MKWLDQTLSELAASKLPDEEKARLMIWTTELSEICDRWMPSAPAPKVHHYRDIWDCVGCRVGWYEPEPKVLELRVGNADGCRRLKMRHGVVQSDVESPNLAVLTSAVRSFFDKWGSP